MFGVNAAFSQGQLCFWNRGKLQEREGSHISKSCTVLILIPSTLLLNLIVEVWHWKSWPHSYLICPSPLFYPGRIYQRQQKNFVFKVCRKILFLRIWTILFFKSSLILQKVCMQLKQSGILYPGNYSESKHQKCLEISCSILSYDFVCEVVVAVLKTISWKQDPLNTKEPTWLGLYSSTG